VPFTGERPASFANFAARKLLYVARIEPHKNHLRLLDAVARLDERPMLVIAGYPTQHEDELRARVAELGLEGDVRILGWVDGADFEGLYALARGFVFPSLDEGFGLPVLEAMARGVPVACSDRASLPEVAGDAALLFDPEDVGDMARALGRLLDDGDLRERLRAAGRSRVEAFSWQAAARAHVATYERALERG
jgi:glycosyltransferase involved in cell wall biosynthesis